MRKRWTHPGPNPPARWAIRLLRTSLLLALTCLWAGEVSQAGSILNFPFLTFHEGTITGVAIVNLGQEEAQVELTAYGPAGQILQGEGIVNPAHLTIGPGTQSGTITLSLFGAGPGPGGAAWFQAVSQNDGLTGFFLHLDTPTTFLDGADLPMSSSRLIFSDVRIGPDKVTELHLINPAAGTAQVSVTLHTGSQNLAHQLELPSKGATTIDVEEIFSPLAAPAGLSSDGPFYVVVESSRELGGFSFVIPSSDLLGLNARPGSERLNRLFFPQLAVLGLFETDLVVVNGGDEAVILTITAFQPDGMPFTAADLQSNPVARALEPGQSLREDVASLFGFNGSQTLDGWLLVESTGESIQGAISYSIPSFGSIASVASVASGTKSAVFSHIATTGDFFTGVAVLNAGKLVANVRITALRQDGTVLGTFATTLGPGRRLSRTLTEMIPNAAGQAGGFILVKSDIPVYLTNVFGTLDFQVLSNVPPQPAPSEFEAEESGAGIEVNPPLAIVPVAGTQQFQVTGPKGAVLWSVDGEPGGGALQGTIDAAGRYTAPAQIPGALPVAVTARIGDDSAGASTDVLSRQLLLGNLGVVQSVAYLSGLQRLYTAELSFSARPAGVPTGTLDSRIFDVTTGIPTEVAQLGGDDIPKMVPFLGSDGREYLLLAGNASGQVIRLDPQTSQTTTVATGLNAPSSLVIDTTSGDLLVAEQSRVTRVPASQLNQGLEGASVQSLARLAGEVIATGDPSGVAVDRCTGDLYVSDGTAGTILQIRQLTGEALTIAQGLSQPGHLLGLYRSGVSCPDSFHLLIVERGSDRVLIRTPQAGVQEWVTSPGIQDLALIDTPPEIIPAGSVAQPGIALGEVSGQVGQISLVPLDLYQAAATNPMPSADLLYGIAAYSENVRLLASPPEGVGNEELTSLDKVFVFLEKTTTLGQNLTPDIGSLIPAGTTIRSYFFHFDTPGTSEGALAPGFVRFDKPILGVLQEEPGLDGTDSLLGAAETDYTGTASRAWSPADSDFVAIADDPTSLDFSAFTDVGQDQLRVLVLEAEAEIIDPPSPDAYQVTFLGSASRIGGILDFIDMNIHGEVVFGGLPGLGDGSIWLPTAKYGLPSGLSTLAVPTTPAGFQSFFSPASINDQGQVVGIGIEGIYRWQNGSFELLDSIFTDSGAFPVELNNIGQMTGTLDDEAFLTSDNSLSLLGTPVAGTGSFAFGLNNLGQVVGAVQPLDGPPQLQGNGVNLQAVVWLSGAGSGQVIATDAAAFDINDSGQIIYTVFGQTGTAAFLRQDGQSTDLGNLGGALTEAYGINNFGQVVGRSINLEFGLRAFRWEGGQMVDLNDLTLGGSATLTSALVIADSGFILCQSGSDLYLLTPIEGESNR